MKTQARSREKVRHLAASVMLALGILASSGSISLAAPPPVEPTFDIEADVSKLNADAAIEGVRLAQDFFIERIETAIDQQLDVLVLAGESPIDPGSLAVSRENTITVYTGAFGWQQLAPAERLAVIVHEYTHFYQYLILGEDSFESPAWFDEGLAEYMSMLAVTELGIISRADIDTYWAMQLLQEPVSESMSELEFWPVFQEADGAVYPLSYFSIALLLQQSELSSLNDFYRRIADGERFEDAFQEVFGRTPAEHYEDLDLWFATLTPANELPPDIAMYSPVQRQAQLDVVEAPRAIVLGDQILVHGLAEPGSMCLLALTPGGGDIVVRRLTFADGTGDVFWLMSIPANLDPGIFRVQSSCGSQTVTWVVVVT